MINAALFKFRFFNLIRIIGHNSNSLSWEVKISGGICLSADFIVHPITHKDLEFFTNYTDYSKDLVFLRETISLS